MRKGEESMKLHGVGWNQRYWFELMDLKIQKYVDI